MSIFIKCRMLTSVQSYLCVLPRLQQTMSTFVGMEYDRDPAPLFTDPETQHLLQSMTNLQINKVFRKTSVPDNSSEYKFLTAEQLEKEFKETVERAKERLQMPPIVKIKEDETKIISKDPALKDFSDTKYVFTDITFGVPPTRRKVVIRQTDGTLEHAPFDIAKRMRQIYFPLNGRELWTPRMFEDVNLKRCLNEHKYEFILDRLTVQYEPFEKEFHRISSIVYQHLNESKQFDSLRSTRHFGPMAFFYSWHKCIDDLLHDMIQRDLLCNGVDLISLLYKIHNIKPENIEDFKKIQIFHAERNIAIEELERTLKVSKDNIQDEIEKAIGKSSKDFEKDELCLKIIDDYIKTNAIKKIELELTVQSLKELNAEKKHLYDGLNKAHGVI